MIAFKFLLILTLFEIMFFSFGMVSCLIIRIFCSSNKIKEVKSLLLKSCKFVLIYSKKKLLKFLKYRSQKLTNLGNISTFEKFLVIVMVPLLIIYDSLTIKAVASCAAFKIKKEHIGDFLDAGNEKSLKEWLEIAFEPLLEESGEAVALNNPQGHVIRFENLYRTKIFDFWLDTAKIKSGSDPKVIDCTSKFFDSDDEDRGAPYIDITADTVDWNGLTTQPRNGIKQRFYFNDENVWKFSQIDLIEADGLVKADTDLEPKVELDELLKRFLS